MTITVVPQLPAKASVGHQATRRVVLRFSELSRQHSQNAEVVGGTSFASRTARTPRDVKRS
jgi:hypothetical protein